MNHTRTRRILLAEDQPEVYTTLVRRLKDEGYAVELATNFVEARTAVDTQYLHLAILDIRLSRVDEFNQDGLRLLEHIDARGLRDVLPSIVITAYGTLPMALHALQELGAVRFIPKEPHYIGKLLQAVQEVFTEKIKIGFDIDYVGNSHALIERGAREIHSRDADPNWPAPDELAPQVDDLLGKLFHEAKRLWIKRLVKGLSGSIVLEVHPTYQIGMGQSLIVKVGRRDKTKIEEANYHKHVERFLPRNHAAQLSAQYARDLGALLYTLADTEAAELVEFETYYQRHAVSEIVAALRQLFRYTCRPWYLARSAPDHENLRDLYLEAFYLKQQPDRLRNEIAGLRPDLQLDAPGLPFNPPGVVLPNPLRWLDDDNAAVLPVCRSTTHGDLNAKNILMNEDGGCWLIDFYRTYESHILRDFVVLETDIKFRLMDTLAPDTFYHLERSLTQLEHPEQSVRPAVGLPASAQKAAEVIAGLRAEAWRLLEATAEDVPQVQREYLVSLLMATLNVIRFRHFKETPELQPRRELALLSAALICQRLAELGAGP